MNKLKKLILSLFVTTVAVTFPVACGETVTKFELSFDTNGGSTISIESVEQGKEFTLPAPTKDGYEFAGWYLTSDFSGEKVTTVTVNEKITVYAKWLKISTVTLNADGGSLSETSVQVKEGDSLYNAVSSLIPQKDGLEFGGWFDGSNEVTSGAVMGTSDVTLTAKYKVQYTVEVYLQNSDKTGYEKAETLTYSDFVGATYVPSVSSEGYTETENENAKTEGVLVENASENVFRHYFDRISLTLTFNPNYPDGKNGEPVILENVDFGADIATPADFEAEGYCLTGWSTTAGGSAEYPANYIYNHLYNKTTDDAAPGNVSDFAESATLYGVWTKGYTDMYGGADKAYLDKENGVIYIDRCGVFFRGEYDYEADTFLFVGEDNKTRFKGKVNDDRTFVYADKERANVSAKLYVPGTGVNDNVVIYFDEYNGLSYVETDALGNSKVSTGEFSIEGNQYTVILDDGAREGEIFTFILGSVTGSNNEKVTAFQKRNEEEISLGLLNRAMIYKGSLISLIDSYYSLQLDGFGTCVFRVDTQTENYYYSLDQENMIITLRNSSLQVVATARVLPLNGKYVWVPYDESYDRKITVGNETLTTDGACEATYSDGTTTVTGVYYTTDSVFGYIVNMYATDGTLYKYLVTATVSEVTTGEGENQKTETVTTYNFTKKPAGYAEYYYSEANGIYRLPLLVLDDTATGKASLYGYTADKTYVKLSSGRYVTTGMQNTYYVDEVFVKDEVTITTETDDDGNVTNYVYSIIDESTGELKVWMRPLINILNIKTAVFAVDTENTDYSVSYWYSYTEEGAEPVVSTERFTAESGETLVRIGSFAQLTTGDSTVVGVLAASSSGYYKFTANNNSLYFELNEENGTFIILMHAPMTVSERTSSGTADSTHKLTLDGKGGAIYTVIEGDGESQNTVTYTGTVTESDAKTAFGLTVYKFRETGKDGITFDYVLLSGSSANYFARENVELKGEFTCGETTLTLDGFFYQASYVDEKGNEVTGLYYTVEDGGICFFADSSYVYFDINGKEFTKRGDEFGSYLILNNQTYGGLSATFDGYGKLVIQLTAKNQEGEYVTKVLDDDVEYEVDGDVCTFTYNDNYGAVTVSGQFGIYTSGSNSYRAFYVINKDTVINLVNASDWSVLSLDGYGNAVKYSATGTAEAGTYMLITDNLLYYLNDENTDASIYNYDLKQGIATPVKFTAFGYYTKDLESLNFTKYGFAIFNGTTRYYYNVVDGICYIYHQEYDENGLIPQETNKYGFIEEKFGEFTAEKEYGGKTYYKDEGNWLTFNRPKDTADNYKIQLNVNGEPTYCNIGMITFMPSGGEEFATTCQLQIGDGYYTAYIYRNVTETETEMYILIPLTVGYYRLDITVSYLGGGKVNTYDIISMKRVMGMQSYNYLYLYYYFGMLFGQSFAQTIPNTYGSIQIVYEYAVDGTASDAYLLGEFGEDSAFYDINGNIIEFEKATLYTDGTGYVAEFKAKTAEGEPEDNYTYRLHFAPQYISALGAYSYRVYGFTRVQTLETNDGYTVEVERLIASELSYPAGYVYALNVKKDGAEIKYDVRLLSDGNWYCISRTLDDAGKIVSTKYYKVVFTEADVDDAGAEEETSVVAPFSSVNVTVEDVETIYDAEGNDYLDINSKNFITFMYVDKTMYAVGECTYDAETGTYSLVTGEGKKFTVKVNTTEEGKTVTITEEVTETEE